MSWIHRQAAHQDVFCYFMLQTAIGFQQLLRSSLDSTKVWRWSFYDRWTYSVKSLPKEIMDKLSTERFKAQLQTYLCTLAYSNIYD